MGNVKKNSDIITTKPKEAPIGIKDATLQDQNSAEAFGKVRSNPKPTEASTRPLVALRVSKLIERTGAKSGYSLAVPGDTGLL